MTKSINELTYKIVAFEEIQQVDTNESIDWAIKMIELGYESASLLMLAGFVKPTNYSEVIVYIKDAVTEIGLEMKYGDDAIVSYSSYYIYQISKKQNIRDNLTELYKFYQTIDYIELIYDFYLLYWAWDDLDNEDNETNHYWDGARRSNIEKTVVKEADKWITKNKGQYEQCIG